MLKLDASRHFFYTGYQRVPARFTVLNLKSGRVVTRRLTGMLPVMALGNRTHYFIQGEWYEAAGTEEQPNQAR
ncbi:hypothetical protein LJY25_17250 [Hymenobacter sp. BT175]|nr:hypothetical protein [Hymenobacter translucens]